MNGFADNRLVQAARPAQAVAPTHDAYSDLGWVPTEPAGQASMSGGGMVSSLLGLALYGAAVGVGTYFGVKYATRR